MNFLIILAYILPFMVIILPHRFRNNRIFDFIIFIPIFLLILSTDNITIKIDFILTGSILGVDEVNKPFIFLTTIVWLSATIFARNYVVKRKDIFFLFWYLTFAGNVGLLLSLDMVTFLVNFTIMSLSAYILIVFDKSEESLWAGKIYIVMVIISEILITFAVFWIVNEIKSYDFQVLKSALKDNKMPIIIMIMVISGFGIKLGLFPLHFWLPLAHPVAPPPASAVLSAVMVKTGVLGMIRFLPEIHSSPLFNILIFLAIIGYFYSVLVVFFENDPKKILAYSTVS